MFKFNKHLVSPIILHVCGKVIFTLQFLFHSVIPLFIRNESRLILKEMKALDYLSQKGLLLGSGLFYGSALID